MKEKQTQKENSKDEKKQEAKPDLIEVKREEYEALVKEAAECKEKCLRLYAEFENTRKRFERERNEFVKYANEGLIEEFLSIMDDLERSVTASKTKHEDNESFRKGVELVMARIHEMLKKNNVKPIESVGRPFDPHCQEVLMQEETSEHEDGTVLEEFQKGYYLGEKVVRTAKVKVAVNISGEEQNKKEGSPQGESK